MLLLLAASAALAAPSAAPPGSVSAEARATIRIVEPVRLKVGARRSEEGLPVRDAVIRTADGRREPAKLVELE